MAVCAYHGLTKGTDALHFDPYAKITRQQLLTILARASNLPDPPVTYAPPFSSDQFYPEEHYLNARRAAYAGRLEGLQDVGFSYDFMSPATRGEVCALLYNLLRP